VIRFGVLGPVAAWNDSGDPIDLKGPQHRAVLARLLVARGRAVPLTALIEDLWEVPPRQPVGAVRTFVGALRKSLEPDRVPRTPSTLLVTVGTGYALRPAAGQVDAERFELAISTARSLPPAAADETLREALGWWRGTAFGDLTEQPWAHAERSRLTEMRLYAVELHAEALLGLAQPAEAVPDLDAHVAEHPWREEGWRLLALALYRSGRQGDALEVLRRARTLLAEQLGLHWGPPLQQLQTDILQHAAHLIPGDAPTGAVERIWMEATTSFQRAPSPGARSRLRSTVDLLRSLAVTGGSGLRAAREQRLATILAAEELGDPVLTARVIGAYDVPAIWSRSDDRSQADSVVAAAERTLVALPSDGPENLRARLLATIAVESRGSSGTRGQDAAAAATQLARRLDDPALLAFALNGLFMQSFHRTGLADERLAIGSKLVELSTRHGLVTYELLGHLVCLQAHSARGDLVVADRHADAADALAGDYESPLVAVFTDWYRALRLATVGSPTAATAYRDAAAGSAEAGMPGFQEGLLPLALLTLDIRQGRPCADDPEWGPYAPWALPHVLLAAGRTEDAAEAVRQLPDPPPDHLLEALWCLTAVAAIAVDDRPVMRRALTALAPAADEQAGAGSGVLTLGPVARYLALLTTALDSARPAEQG